MLGERPVGEASPLRECGETMAVPLGIRKTGFGGLADILPLGGSVVPGLIAVMGDGV